MPWAARNFTLEMEPFKKVKTSIALRPDTIAELKRLAKLEGRSVSNMLQRFIDLKLREASRRKSPKAKTLPKVTSR